MVRRMFLLVMLGTFLALGGFWALRAQDPAPKQTPTQTTTPAEKQTMRRRLSSIFPAPTPGRLLIAKVLTVTRR
jgi:hypothetical protein